MRSTIILPHFPIRRMVSKIDSFTEFQLSTYIFPPCLPLQKKYVQKVREECNGLGNG